MSNPSVPHCPSSILNFRDIASVNKTTGTDIVRPGLVFRSANPDKATVDEVNALRNAFGLKTTVDLRGDSHSDKNKHNSKYENKDGNKYSVDLNGREYQWALLKQLKWGPWTKVIYLGVRQQRTAATNILAENVMNKKGLVGLAEDTLKASTKGFKEIFTLLAKPASYPFHFYCQQGKDRTGLTIILLLLLLQVPVSAIKADYMLSASELIPEKAERLQELREMGLPDTFADCDPDLVDSVRDWLEKKYGGIEDYLSHIGISRSAQESVRRILLA